MENREPIARLTDELSEIAESLEIMARADRLSFKDVVEHAEHVFSIRHTLSDDVIQDAVQKLAIVVCRSVFRKIDDVSGDPVTHQVFIDMLKDIEKENALRQARLTAYNFHFESENGHKSHYVQDVADESMKRIIDNFDPRSMSDGYAVYQAVVVEIYNILSKSGQAVPLEWNMPVRKESAQKIIIEWNDIPELNKIEYSPVIRQLFRTARQAVTESKTVRQSDPHYVYILDDSTKDENPEYEIYRRFKSCALIGGQNSMTLNTSANLNDEKALSDFLTALKLTDIQRERLMMKANGMTFRDMCMRDGKFTVSHPDPSGKKDKNGRPVMVKIHGSKVMEMGYVIQPTDKITYSTRCYQDTFEQIRKKVNAYADSVNGSKYKPVIDRIMDKLTGRDVNDEYDYLAMLDADENLTAMTERNQARKHFENVRQTARQTARLTERHEMGYYDNWKSFTGSTSETLTAKNVCQTSHDKWSESVKVNDWKTATYKAHVQPRQTVTVYNSKQTARQAVRTARLTGVKARHAK